MARGRRHKPKKNFAEKRREKKNEKKKAEGQDTRAAHTTYAEIIRENEDFETYYKTQNIVPENEWTTFMNKMKENLPAAFRITGSKAETKSLLNIIKGSLFKEILNADPDKELQPRSLPFYPDELAWQLQLTRKDIRRSEAYSKLHNFLISETDTGNISRQEAVSMIPPLLLDIKPWHKVLDMCAAPGSKTAQLIEMIHADEKIAIPEGLVVANDLDNSRCYMLVHQAKRLNSPNILITNHDSSVMPNFITLDENGSKKIMKFDRILADVPCSGDGTMRKNPDIWCKWKTAIGNNLHGIQYRIAKRGAELLTIGGRMVYSTCSLNPIENEAVIHRLLSEAGDSLKLINGKELVPGLVFNSGLNTWKVASKNLEFYDCYEDVPEQLRTIIRPKMFPPSNEAINKYNLERCMRILPHHQDTGGFFMAVLEKVKHLPWENEFDDSKNIENSKELNDNKNILANEKSFEEPKLKRRKFQGYKEDPFIFFNENEDIWPSIKEFYEISDKLDPKCLLVRCLDGKKKNVYFTSSAIRNIVQLNNEKIKIINTGVKAFVRCDNKHMKCSFRLAQEGLSSVKKFMGERRRLEIGKDDLTVLLQNNDHQNPPLISTLSQVFQEKLKNFDHGSCILSYEEKSTETDFNLKFEVVGWKGTISFRAYISVQDAIHFLRILGADISMYEKNKFQANNHSALPAAMEQNEVIEDPVQNL